MIASVSGSRTVTVLPSPSMLARSTVPRRASMLWRTTSMPTPRPERSVTVSALENPGAKTKPSSSASGSCSGCAPRPVARARSAMRARLELEPLGAQMGFEDVATEAVRQRREHLGDPAARDRDFAREIEHAVELGDVDAQRAGLGGAGSRLSRLDVVRLAGACVAERPARGVEICRSGVAAHERAEHIYGAQQQGNRFGTDGDFTGAQQVEDIFDLVREFGDLREPDHRRVALEAVDRAEDLLEEIGVGRTRLERHELLLEAAKVVRRLGAEGFEHQGAIAIGDGH